MERPRWRRLLLNPIIWASAGAIVGIGVMWWLTRPWLEFDWLMANYRPGAHRIAMVGEFHVNRGCPPDDVIWRTEARANDGQVAIYAPTELPPDLSAGRHQYVGEIALEKPILPDTWMVQIIVSCKVSRKSSAIAALFTGDGYGIAASKLTSVIEEQRSEP